MNSIRARKTKFVCVNDDMKNPTPGLLMLLKNFYLSFFPEPSRFELPFGTENSQLYLDAYERDNFWDLLMHFFGFVASASMLAQALRSLSSARYAVEDKSSKNITNVQIASSVVPSMEEEVALGTVLQRKKAD